MVIISRLANFSAAPVRVVDILADGTFAAGLSDGRVVLCRDPRPVGAAAVGAADQAETADHVETAHRAEIEATVSAAARVFGARPARDDTARRDVTGERGITRDVEPKVVSRHPSGVAAVCLSRDGAVVASLGTDGKARLFDARSGRRTLLGGRDVPVLGLEIVGGSVVVTRDARGVVRLVPLDAGDGRAGEWRLTPASERDDRAPYLDDYCLTHWGQRMVVRRSDTPRVHVYDLVSRELVHDSFDYVSGADRDHLFGSPMAVSPNGDRLARVTSASTVTVAERPFDGGGDSYVVETDGSPVTGLGFVERTTLFVRTASGVLSLVDGSGARKWETTTWSRGSVAVSRCRDYLAAPAGPADLLLVDCASPAGDLFGTEGEEYVSAVFATDGGRTLGAVTGAGALEVWRYD